MIKKLVDMLMMFLFPSLMKRKYQPTFQIKRKAAEIVFVDKANAIHDNKYVYPVGCYTGSKNELHVICHKHGPFVIGKAYYHLYTTRRPKGCPFCDK